MKKNNLNQVYLFMKQNSQLRTVSRHNKATPKPIGNPEEWRSETVAEHSWSVADFVTLALPLLEEEFGCRLDELKMIKMALLHDKVEMVVGDASIWHEQKRKNVKPKEQAAAKDFFTSMPFPHGEEMHQLWQECEDAETLEAKIVRGLDALDPVFQRIMTEDGWVEVGKSEQDLDRMKLPKVQFSKTLTTIYEMLKTEARDKNYFAS